MKLLHVIPAFAPAWRYGGPVYAADGLTHELARLGHEVSVMTTNIDGAGVLDVPLGRPVLRDGVETWYFPVEPPRWWCFSRPLGHAIRRQARDFDVVHIHSMFLWPTSVAAFWCQKRGVPYVIKPAGSLDPVCFGRTYDGSWNSLVSKAKKLAYLKIRGRADLEGASAIHFTSQTEMEAARYLKLTPPGIVVPMGVHIDEIGETLETLRLRDRYQQLRERKVILYLSRLDRKKGLHVLIAALSDLVRKRKDFALVIAGGGTATYEAEVVALIKTAKLDDRTVFCGFVQGRDRWALLREADLFVLPSFRENFGLAIVEAMAAGVPVVISSGVNIHREISEGRAGLVTDPEPTQMAAAIEHLLADDDARREIGQNGVRLVRSRFTWERAGRELVHAYETITRARSARSGKD
jgi:glycosyltransferase involved in cell wall biosynthesis